MAIELKDDDLVPFRHLIFLGAVWILYSLIENYETGKISCLGCKGVYNADALISENPIMFWFNFSIWLFSGIYLLFWSCKKIYKIDFGKK